MHHDPHINTYEETLAHYAFGSDVNEFKELHYVAMRLVRIREQLDRVKQPNLLFNIRHYVNVLGLRKEREQLYKEIKKADIETRCDVYDCMPEHQRDMIPLSVWNYNTSMDRW